MHPNSVGDRDCECGHVADIRQSAKPGRYLYSVCEGCKTDQSTGAYKQNLWWHSARFRAGANPIKPCNVTDDWQPPASKQGAKLAAEPQAKVGPKGDDLTEGDLLGSVVENQPEPQQSLEGERTGKRKSGVFGVVGFLLILCSMAGVAWATTASE